MTAYTGDTQKLKTALRLRMHYTELNEGGEGLIGHTIDFTLISHDTLEAYWVNVVEAQGALFEVDGKDMLVPLNSIIGVKVIDNE